MSWLSSAIKGIGHAATDVGHFVGKVASNPIVTGAAGLLGGPLGGAIVGGAGRLLAPGGNLGSAVSGAATGGLLGGGARLLGGAGGLGGAIKGTFGGNLGKLLHTGTMGGDQVPLPNIDYGGIQDAIGRATGTGGGGGGIGGFLSGAGRLLGGGGNGGGLNLGNLAMGGLAAYQGINAANAAKRAGDLQNRALDMAQQRYDAGAPLRSAGLSRLLGAGSVADAYADPTNPFASMPQATASVPRLLDPRRYLNARG